MGSAQCLVYKVECDLVCDDGNELSEKHEDENTKRKTFYDSKVFMEFLDTCDEKREIEDVTPVELREIIKKIRSCCVKEKW